MPSVLLGQKAQEEWSPQPTLAPTSSGLRELKESAVVSEEMDREWRRFGPAEASEACREREWEPGARGMRPSSPCHAETASVHPPFLAQTYSHP